VDYFSFAYDFTSTISGPGTLYDNEIASWDV
jgi:hypothetical protein